jgi:hypothetical protein
LSSFKWSPLKQPTQHYEEEDAEDPIQIKLGNVELTYDNRSWHIDGQSSGRSGVKAQELVERNRLLEAENQLLKYKMNVLLDMVCLSFWSIEHKTLTKSPASSI